MEAGDFCAVNSMGFASQLNHHFLIYLGNELFFDTINACVYEIPLNEAEGAAKTKNIIGDIILEFVAKLPKEVMEVVEANAKEKTPIKLHIFTNV